MTGSAQPTGVSTGGLFGLGFGGGGFETGYIPAPYGGGKRILRPREGPVAPWTKGPVAGFKPSRDVNALEAQAEQARIETLKRDFRKTLELHAGDGHREGQGVASGVRVFFLFFSSCVRFSKQIPVTRNVVL